MKWDTTLNITCDVDNQQRPNEKKEDKLLNGLFT